MRSILRLLGARVVPALVTAAGVVLVTAGLLSYADPATAGPLPSQAVVESADPSFAVVDPTDAPDPADSPDPSPSGGPSPSATPRGTAPASIVPTPTRKPGRAVATRVVVAALHIDLPVVKGNSGYPYCNVAMYLHNGKTVNDAKGDSFGQPGEGRATYIYAHARDGMFGPIYNLAMVQKNAKKMLGMVVQVYTSDFKLYLYEIREYHLHSTSLDGATGARKEELWLQTSEGPHGTPGKTQLVAYPLSVSPASPRDAVPTPHPVVCG
jgi:hypothetical protein